EDKTTDAGEIGTGFTLSLCFEIELEENADLSSNKDIANVNIRYKDAKANAEDPSDELDLPITSDCFTDAPSQDDYFVASVIEFALILLDSNYKADADLGNVIERLQGMELSDEYKLQFLQLVKTYKDGLSKTYLR
ncbi:MAG: DUF3520 domain-containing protein, partial [Clostridia bacterium]|nr:DUF3520 domain-containing protein [Clostridia bacterium]